MSNDLIAHAEYPFARTKPVKEAGIVTLVDALRTMAVKQSLSPRRLRLLLLPRA